MMKVTETWRSTKIEDCEFRIRTRKMCGDAGLATLGQADPLDWPEMKALGLGIVAFAEIKGLLEAIPGSRYFKLLHARTTRDLLESRIARLEIELAATKAELNGY
ncbi:hypothetical protein [Sphingopyxis sp. 22461]|uniref:hypothetical protein n=1 Tax=Sphingopyxis sp. 22461 TaxID=3453923 RepID=UPI003F87BF56